MSTTALRRYFRGATLVAMQDVAANTRKTYHYDHLGTVQCLTDSTGAVTDRFAADAWGVQVKRTGSSINRQWFVGNLGYARQVDQAVDYVRARSLQVAAGRWLSVDPVRTGLSYAYAQGSPGKYSDLSGLFACLKGVRLDAHGCRINPGFMLGHSCKNEIQNSLQKIITDHIKQKFHCDGGPRRDANSHKRLLLGDVLFCLAGEEANFDPSAKAMGVLRKDGVTPMAFGLYQLGTWESEHYCGSTYIDCSNLCFQVTCAMETYLAWCREEKSKNADRYPPGTMLGALSYWQPIQHASLGDSRFAVCMRGRGHIMWQEELKGFNCDLCSITP